jgi:hypothetical protein
MRLNRFEFSRKEEIRMTNVQPIAAFTTAGLSQISPVGVATAS